jgi:hypothetical protein
MVLIDYLRFYVPLKNCSLIWRRHHYRWRAAKFRPMLGAQSFWAGRDLYRATPAVTRDLDFSGFIRRTAPFSRLLRHTRGCGGSILTRIQFHSLSQTLLEFIPVNCYTIFRTLILSRIRHLPDSEIGLTACVIIQHLTRNNYSFHETDFTSSIFSSPCA